MSQVETEIREQPDVLGRLLREGRGPVEAIAARIRERKPHFVVIAARGSSDNAARYAQYLFGAHNRLPVCLVALARASLLAAVLLIAAGMYAPQGVVNAANPSGSDAYVWTTQTVDAPMYFDWMSDRSMRLDSSGNPHIAYGGDHLYYATYTGSGWQVQTVDQSNGVG